MTQRLCTTQLHLRHVEQGARMVPFAGFEMPLLYTSILEEHRAVRSSAGLFDVSHMGEIRLRGRDALATAQLLFSNDVAGTEVGRVRYGLLCLEDGGVVDDVTLYRAGEDEVLFCVNASNIAEDLAWMREVQRMSGLACEIIDESAETALLALQGPRALALVAPLLPPDTRPPRRWRFVQTQLAGIPVWLSRTGYTGEDGYEMYTRSERVVALWDALREAGGEALSPAGLGARDTLRTEMAYPLYGHELDREHNPVEAGLERFLAFGRGFSGEAALRRVCERGPEQRLAGLLLEGRQVARSGYPILAEARIGTITSGTYGPSVERSIALGYLEARYAEPGSCIAVEVRGRGIPCKVTKTPFYGRKG